MGPSPHLWFLHAKTASFGQDITSLYGSQTSPVVLCIQNSVLRTRIACLYCSQISPVILCMQNIVIRTRITGLYGSQTLTCRFAHAQQRDFAQESQICVIGTCPRHLWVPALICGFCMQNSDFWARITSLYGSQTSPVVLYMQNSVISTRND